MLIERNGLVLEGMTRKHLEEILLYYLTGKKSFVIWLHSSKKGSSNSNFVLQIAIFLSYDTLS